MSELFIKKKIRRNIRGKTRHSDDEEDHDSSSKDQHRVIEGLVVRDRSTVQANVGLPRNTSVLSFEDDLNPDCDETFQVKKNALSRASTKQTKDDKEEGRKKKQKNKINNDIPKVVGRIEPTQSKIVKKEEEEDGPGCDDSEDRLEYLRRQLMELDDAPDDNNEGNSKSDRPTSVYFKDGAIPDATAIHLARKQREKAKFMLGVAEASADGRGQDGESGRRLVREDDADDDDDEDDDDIDDIDTGSGPSAYRRPAFVVSEQRHTKSSRRRDISSGLNRRQRELDVIRQNFLAAEHGSDGSDRDNDKDVSRNNGDEDDDEHEGWERQQIKKAIITQNPAILEAILPTDDRQSKSKTSSAKSLTMAGLDISNVNLTGLKDHLKNKFSELSTSLERNKSQLVEYRQNLDQGKQVISDSRSKLPQCARRFGVIRDVKNFFDDLVECFNEKLPRIEYLERRSIALYRERYTKLIGRRRMDMKDLADAASQSTGQPVKTNEDPKVAEARRRRCAEREARRNRRQRAREAALFSNQDVSNSDTSKDKSHLDGTSTDDEESQAVVAKREADFDSLLVDARGIFEDVVDEFCKLPLILNRFAEWRHVLPDLYCQAYASLCLPQLFSPIVRLELVQWNPIGPSKFADDLDQMTWFQDLLDFVTIPTSAACDSGSKSDAQAAAATALAEDDDDSNNLRLIPQAVERTVLGRLNDLVNACWDPLSCQQSKRLVKMVHNLTTTYPTLKVGSRPTEKLFTSIVKRMEETIQEDSFIPLYSKKIMSQRQSAAFQFFDRQMNAAMKLLSNILLWHNLISREVLQHVALHCLVNRYLLVGLASLLSASTADPSGQPANLNALYSYIDAVKILKSVVTLLPADWLKSSRKRDTDGARSPAGSGEPFDQLRRFIGQMLEHTPADSAGSRPVAGQPAEKDSSKVLVQLQRLLKRRTVD